jgi:hypothetical protein
MTDRKPRRDEPQPASSAPDIVSYAIISVLLVIAIGAGLYAILLWVT